MLWVRGEELASGVRRFRNSSVARFVMSFTSCVLDGVSISTDPTGVAEVG